MSQLFNTMRDQVYQPTTTTLPHDRSKTWMPSFLAQSSSGSLWSRTLVLILSVMFAVMGLVMIIVGAISYQSLDEGSVKEVNSTAYVIILCLGVLLELVAIIAVVFYMRNMGYNIPCCPGKIARIRKRLHENQMMVNGQMVSTGEPVSAQYCPPSHPGVGNTPPPPYTDVSEEQHLMEEKIDIGDDTERILEEDPRIVLTPLKPHEEC
ncbi:uncharacterized protein [Palaemon carinicauda]|uniref:uncharacterized protein isoform X1 n=2 Tax=Palaemon carinicauda TaxID=392227 RepID=UPI0035B57B44